MKYTFDSSKKEENKRPNSVNPYKKSKENFVL